jgi:hypothetical protein
MVHRGVSLDDLLLTILKLDFGVTLRREHSTAAAKVHVHNAAAH